MIVLSQLHQVLVPVFLENLGPALFELLERGLSNDLPGDHLVVRDFLLLHLVEQEASLLAFLSHFRADFHDASFILPYTLDSSLVNVIFLSIYSGPFLFELSLQSFLTLSLSLFFLLGLHPHLEYVLNLAFLLLLFKLNLGLLLLKPPNTILKELDLCL